MRSIKSILFMAIAAGLIACGGAGLEDDSEVAFANFNLEAEDGGFTETSETIAFEDDDPSAFQAEGPALSEPMVDTEVSAMGKEALLDRYEIRLIWGQPRLTPETPVSDWTGAVSTTLGAIRVIRTIRFEQNDGLLERTSPQSVEFESHTTVHNDGLRLRLLVPKNPAIDVAGQLTIQLGDTVDVTIDHVQLRHLVRAKKVDDLGNGVAIMAFKHTPCPKGMLRGHWKRLNDRGGVFGGAVANADGNKIGRLAGIWGVRNNGKRRFYGLFIQDGKPAGVVRGTWKSLPNKAGGVFRGQFVSQGKEHKGSLRGLYKTSEAGGFGRFMGVWNEKGCDAADGPITTTPEVAAGDADLCSADGVCVAEPTLSCSGEDCSDSTDE